MGDFGLPDGAIEAVIHPGLTVIAEKVAVRARNRFRMHELKTDDPKMGVIVEETPLGPDVVTYNPFAHIDEYGGPHVHWEGSGALRSAAVEEGVFVPDPKPR